MLHLDGSVHAWFTGEELRPCLIAVSDDATKRVVHAALYPSESTWAVMSSLAIVFRTAGLPGLTFFSSGSGAVVHGSRALGVSHAESQRPRR